jgi:Apea-like HEPN
MIDVATSLLRLSLYNHLTAASNGLFPEVGQTEPMPSRVPESETSYLLITAQNISTGGMWMPHMYFIDDSVISATLTDDFKRKTQMIFCPAQGSLAERFGQGLGWLSRGRQSEDRAERFLFFFTAIEALLSSDNKSAPIIQNIARSAAVILKNDVAARAKTAGEIKSLYAERSALVHAGRRSISRSSVNAAQWIAEALYTRVLECIPLTNSFASFQAGLDQATYGLRWPEPSTSA